MKFLFDRILLPFAAPLLVLIIWELIAIELKNDVVLPTVGQVWVLFLHPNEDLLRLGSLLQNLGMSSIRVLCGYSAGLVLALPLGILMGHYKKVNRFMTPLVEILRPMPPLAWIPLILAWFGVASFATMLGIEEGEWYVFFNNIKFSMLIIIFIGAFFPRALHAHRFGARPRRVGARHFYENPASRGGPVDCYGHEARPRRRVDVPRRGGDDAGKHIGHRLRHHARLHRRAHGYSHSGHGQHRRGGPRARRGLPRCFAWQRLSR